MSERIWQWAIRGLAIFMLVGMLFMFLPLSPPGFGIPQAAVLALVAVAIYLLVRRKP